MPGIEMMDMAMEDSAEAVSSVSEKSAVGGGDGGGDYSETNIQVAGVDEAEIVKTDGEYIYYYHQVDEDNYQSFAVSVARTRS